jgi:hypothetical protein
LFLEIGKTWMPGIKPGMTERLNEKAPAARPGLEFTT